jgi:hypothetical protein
MRTPFKLRSSPTKGKLGDFFKSVGSQLRSNKRDIGADLKEKYNRTKESTPKAGESKYQANVRTRRATKKSKPGEFTTKQKLEGNLVPNQELMKKKVPKVVVEKPVEKVKVVKKPNSKITGAIGSKTRKDQYDAKGWKYDDTIEGYNRDGSKKVKSKPKTKTPKTKIVQGKHGAESVKPGDEPPTTGPKKINTSKATKKTNVKKANATQTKTKRVSGGTGMFGIF